MASFRKDRITGELEHYTLPFALMQNGYVTTYRRRDVLDNDAAELRRLGFIVREFDCAAWDDDPAMHNELRVELGLPDWTGQGFDALNDSLTDMEVPDDGGVVIVLDNFDDRRRRDRVLLDVLASSARYWLLFGRLQPVLIRVVDPNYQSPTDLGGTRAWWKHGEGPINKRSGKRRATSFIGMWERVKALAKLS